MFGFGAIYSVGSAKRGELHPQSHTSTVQARSEMAYIRVSETRGGGPFLHRSFTGSIVAFWGVERVPLNPKP